MIKASETMSPKKRVARDWHAKGHSQNARDYFFRIGQSFWYDVGNPKKYQIVSTALTFRLVKTCSECNIFALCTIGKISGLDYCCLKLYYYRGCGFKCKEPRVDFRDVGAHCFLVYINLVNRCYDSWLWRLNLYWSRVDVNEQFMDSIKLAQLLGVHQTRVSFHIARGVKQEAEDVDTFAQGFR